MKIGLKFSLELLHILERNIYWRFASLQIQQKHL